MDERHWRLEVRPDINLPILLVSIIISKVRLPIRDQNVRFRGGPPEDALDGEDGPRLGSQLHHRLPSPIAPVTRTSEHGLQTIGFSLLALACCHFLCPWRTGTQLPRADAVPLADQRALGVPPVQAATPCAAAPTPAKPVSRLAARHH